MEILTKVFTSQVPKNWVIWKGKEQDEIYKSMEGANIMGGDMQPLHTIPSIKKHLVGPDKLYKQSLDSAVSSLLALISRAYAQLV